MQFGLLFMMYAPAPSSDETLYREVLEQVEEADRLGYDIAWFAEHHFEPRSEFNGRLPSPMLFIAAAASRTKRIRLGNGVRVLPIHDPFILAEEAAVADLLTGGRLILGAGQGGGNDFETFGVVGDNKYALFRETLDVMAAAWRPGLLNHESESFRYQGAVSHPEAAPAARRHHLGGSSQPGSDRVRWAQRVLPVDRPVRADRPTGRLRQAVPRGRAGRRPARRALAALASCTSGGPTPRPARTSKSASGGTTAGETTNGYFKQAINDGLLAPTAQPTLEEVMGMVEFIVGGPDTVAEQLATFCDELQVSSLTCMMHVAGITHDQMLRSMRLFIEEVKPRLLAKLAVPAAAVEEVGMRATTRPEPAQEVA